MPSMQSTSVFADVAGVTDLPAELSRCFLLIRELDQKSTALQTEIENRCRKHVTEHAAEHEVTCTESNVCHAFVTQACVLFMPVNDLGGCWLLCMHAVIVHTCCFTQDFCNEH